MEMWLTTEPAQSKRISRPDVQIGIWRELPLHGGQVVKLGPNSNAGFASRCAKLGDCERAESATITLNSYQQGSGATGRYQLHFKGGERFARGFLRQMVRIPLAQRMSMSSVRLARPAAQ
jgi:hypothetical protein